MPSSHSGPSRSSRRSFLGTAAGLLGASSVALASPARPRIVFFSPNSEGNSYWPQVFRIMGKVARDLDFEFVPYSFGVRDRFARQHDALRILATEPRPQAIISAVVIGQSQGLVEAANALNIPVFILGPLFPSELPALGWAPRRKYRSWVALFNWAEERKGHALGKALIDEARKQRAWARDGSVHVVGLGGDPSWFGSGLRQAGLVRAVGAEPKVALRQVVPTRWTLDEGRELTMRLLRRHPETSVVWAASDQLGAGAAQALEASGRALGRTAFTGGLDLSELGLGLVNQGKFVATAASTMLSYAQVAVLAHDYLHGHDFAEQYGGALEFPTYVATRANADLHLRLSRCDAIDFRAFSKVHNRKLKRYDFSLEAYSRAASACTDG